MSDEVKPGPGVFDVAAVYGHAQDGMNLRDWFAGMAMQAGVMLNQQLAGHDFEQIAVECYRMADAMLAERGKRDE